MEHPWPCCPYLDRRDARCAGFLTLTNISEAFRRCASAYDSCIIYHEIRLADRRREHELAFAQSA